MIETHALRRTFRSRDGPVEAVAGVDLRVEAGEVFGFLGPNGAGKTTTLRMLSTLLTPTGGEATVAGCDLRREPKKVRERIGYVGQLGGTDPQVTGRMELEFQARLYGASAAEARIKAQEMLSALELDAAADRTTGTYSGGQRRRLDVGLGLIHGPRLLFLDEPTTGLVRGAGVRSRRGVALRPNSWGVSTRSACGCAARASGRSLRADGPRRTAWRRLRPSPCRSCDRRAAAAQVQPPSTGSPGCGRSTDPLAATAVLPSPFARGPSSGPESPDRAGHP